MTSPDWHDELDRLADALCEDELSREDAARLATLLADSRDCQSALLRYLQLHGELLWEHTAATRSDPIAAILRRKAGSFDGPHSRGDSAPPWRGPRSRLLWLAVTIGFLVLLLIAWVSPRIPREEPPVAETTASSVRPVARVTATHRAHWVLGATAWFEGARLTAGKRLDLHSGFVELGTEEGTRLLLRGPAQLTLLSSNQIQLAAGALGARTGPNHTLQIHARAPLAVRPASEVSVSATPQAVEIHVRAGRVDVGGLGGDRTETRSIRPGETLELACDPTGTLLAQPRDAPTLATIFEMPASVIPDGAAARLRALVERHPRLIHHYPFEGTTRAEKCRDWRGSLHLIETIMHGGRALIPLDYTTAGIDPSTDAVTIARERTLGNERGIALQSEDKFYPPPAMTAELLVRYVATPEEEEDPIGVLLGTRGPGASCGFFLAAVDQGYLAHLFDADAPWSGPEQSLVPDVWYYLAATFETLDGETRVNVFWADLSQSDAELEHVLRDETVGGVPAISRLGIGKGFNEFGAHAYPWSGSLDEVAVYDTVLARAILEEHLATLTGNRP